VATFFLQPTGRKWVATPFDTHLVLSIVLVQAASRIDFTIRDTTIGEVFNASIPYSGGPFYGMYTQLEWQPCCSLHPIQQYHFTGSVYDITITTTRGTTEPLPSSYMLPFILDAPPGWSFGYYQDGSYGYHQIA
jgi:hypothetical protein